MSIRHCSDCGQSMPKDRDAEVCERCEKLQQVDELQAELAHLRATLQRRQAESDRLKRVIALLERGLSPAQALDWAMVEEGPLQHKEWAETRGVSPAAVYNNISSAQDLVKSQAELSDTNVWQEMETGEEDEHRGDGAGETDPDSEEREQQELPGSPAGED